MLVFFVAVLSLPLLYSKKEDGDVSYMCVSYGGRVVIVEEFNRQQEFKHGEDKREKN